MPPKGVFNLLLQSEEFIIAGNSKKYKRYGYTEDSNKQRLCVNEGYSYSPSTGAWSHLAYSNSNSLPQPRLVSQAVIIGSTLWLIGGWNSNIQGPEAFLGDVWQLDLNSRAWTQVKPAGEELQGISRFQAAADGAKIYIHTHRTLDHILVLDTAAQPTPTLQKVPVHGNSPSSRGLHSMVKVGRGLYVFGGAPQQGPMLNDLHRLDLDTLTWEQLQPAGDTPHVRCSTAAAAVDQQYIVYIGGAFYGDSGGLEMLGDVHVLDTKANAWLEVAVEGDLPAARNAAVIAPLLSPAGAEHHAANKLLLYGGWRAFKETYNDSFIITVNNK
eukprot:gene10210-10371_t